MKNMVKFGEHLGKRVDPLHCIGRHILGIQGRWLRVNCSVGGWQLRVFWWIFPHHHGWWYFTTMVFGGTSQKPHSPISCLSLLPKKWLQENQSYLHPVTRTSCLFDLIKGSFKFTENLFHHIGLATVVMCSQFIVQVKEKGGCPEITQEVPGQICSFD